MNPWFAWDIFTIIGCTYLAIFWGMPMLAVSGGNSEGAKMSWAQAVFEVSFMFHIAVICTGFIFWALAIAGILLK